MSKKKRTYQTIFTILIVAAIFFALIMRNIKRSHLPESDALAVIEIAVVVMLAGAILYWGFGKSKG